VTGRAFRSAVSLTTISEPQAIEYALRAAFEGQIMPDALISAGGETQMLYKVGPHGAILSAQSGNKCASGTGEFFLQQIRRMGLELPEAIELGLKGTPHQIAGRCSVFCKSDCTHALNKGVPREDVAAGLCSMMADKLAELVKDIDVRRLGVVGGGALNGAMIEFLRKRFPNLSVPRTAAVFEAYGAALWALEHHCLELPPSAEAMLKPHQSSFATLTPLIQSESLVSFKSISRAPAQQGDRCIVGLDVGSTTTKAVLMRFDDNAMVASVYLRTNGEPVGAARACYRALLEQLGGCRVDVCGIGVTGSGRQIAGLHALTQTVINEIIAHATAAAFFDQTVDTIFEIGGQDAKYTYLTAGVPSDYAMNEACSAGTGSFLEEAALETLNVGVEQIASRAMAAAAPPNFSDECAAFIGSDIKRAAQEGIERDDILAGLVYSICQNYLNRVKGSRPVGKTIFMQGGVCYNRAVPIAMATLLKTPIVVPPEPGLMGAFGVALEVKKRQQQGLALPASFDLETLSQRQAATLGHFTCAGGAEKCDRKCRIARIEIDGKSYPFGGMCDKYYNQRVNQDVDTRMLDYGAVRDKLFWEHVPPEVLQPLDPSASQRTVGINRSFLMHSLLPLFATFFKELGCRVVVPEDTDRTALGRAEAAYCWPAQLCHGTFARLLDKKLDYLFLPQIMQLPIPNVPTFSRTCVFVQGEPYYLKTTFREELESSTTLALCPVLKLENGYEAGAQSMVEVAQNMGLDGSRARLAWQRACERQREFEKRLQERGREALAWLDANPKAFGMVLLGRPYNAFAADVNMGIPHKVASRGTLIIPHDMLPTEEYEVDYKMFWAMGQKIMKAGQLIARRDNLFGLFITNFSCGPDSFLLTFFRNLMKSKPSLTLELDQHTASAGIDTRVEAALDIMTSYRAMQATRAAPRATPYRPARLLDGNPPRVIASDGTEYPLAHERVEVLLPSMGRYATAAVAAILRRAGIRARELPIANHETLLQGRKHASCKECLPYLVTSGSFLHDLAQKTDATTVSLLFIPTGGGPCRLGQYCRALEQTIHEKRLENVAVMTVTDENGYGGLGSKNLLMAWQSIVAADVFDDIRSMLTVTAREPQSALKKLDSYWNELLAYFEGRLSVRYSRLLAFIAQRLKDIELLRQPAQVPVVSLIGEYYVRKDAFSRMNVIDYLQQHGFMVRVAPAMEYLLYSNYNVNNGLQEGSFSAGQRIAMRLRAQVQEWWERRIKGILSTSGLYAFELVDVEQTIQGVSHLIDHNFRGETILTVGSGMREILNHSCGIVSIGPFGCMPSRMAEAILKKELTVAGKARMPGWHKKALRYSQFERFPFLSIETDGKPFPQIIEANLEAFVLQARRLHEAMGAQDGGKQNTGHKKAKAAFSRR
jgi:predicted CoA-substrate-specific enzyme activase